MKKIVALFLCAILVISIPCVAFADGSGNMDGGGGGMGTGTNDNIWHDGEDGVRVTVVRANDNSPVSTPVDLTNKKESDVVGSFVKKCKLNYRNGATLEPNQGTYTFTNPGKQLPKIISDSGNANIADIRNYFTKELIIKYIATLIGASYDTLINGNYKLLIEPLAYFTFQGHKFAMTATEAAKYDQALSGGLRSKMVSLTHQNLPLSLFLQTSDMGYPAYSGSTTKAQSDSTIISSLGLGIVKFGTTPPPPPPQPTQPDTDEETYRVDTDVITSVNLSAGSEINPDGPAKVTFHIGGGTYTVTNIVIPSGESQVVWVKWHTPSTPQTVNISVSASKGSLDFSAITATIESLADHDPPDPKSTDRNDSFVRPSLPDRTERTASSWGVWNAEWVPVWVWHEDWKWIDDPDSPSGGHWKDKGKWVDEGYWQWDFTSYHATLTANMNLLPDDKDPTAQGKVMRSGYGVKIDISSSMRSSASTSHYTCAQTAVTYFPEFAYNTYWRLLDLTADGDSSTFAFKNNIYSTYSRCVHFTPIWFPDGKYTAYTYLEDAWTPAGMLSLNLNDYVTINGNAFDDWHVGPKLVD